MGGLTEDQQVLGHADTHLGAVLALFRPREAVGLGVLANHVGDDGLHAHVGPAVLDEGAGHFHVERIDGLEAEAGHAARNDTILHVDASQAPGNGHAQHFRDQIVHLLEEMRVIVGVPEVGVVRRVLVLGTEGDTGDGQADAVVFHAAGFEHSVIVDDGVVLALDLDAFHTHGAGECLRHGGDGQAVLLDDLGHALNHGVVLLPLPFQLAADVALGLGVDQVDAHAAGLQEAVQAVNGLDEVVELEADAQVDGPRAVALEVAAAAGNHRFGGQLLELAVAELDDRALALFQILGAVDAYGSGDGGLDRVAFRLEVMPDDPVSIWGLGADLHQFGDPGGQALAFLGGGVLHANSGITKQASLAIALVAGVRVVRRYFVPADVQFR